MGLESDEASASSEEMVSVCLDVVEAPSAVVTSSSAIHNTASNYDQREMDDKEKQARKETAVVSSEDEEKRRDEKKRLWCAIGGLLLVYLFFNIAYDGVHVILICLCHPRDTGAEVDWDIAFYTYLLAVGVSCILSFVGGILADAYTGRIPMLLFSVGIKLIGALMILLSNSVGHLFEIRYIYENISCNHETIGSAAEYIYCIGCGFLVLSGIGISSLEALFGDQVRIIYFIFSHTLVHREVFC